jgi:hypothetical protein
VTPLQTLERQAQVRDGDVDRHIAADRERLEQALGLLAVAGAKVDQRDARGRSPPAPHWRSRQAVR